jgi:hypothetical protein
MNNLKPYYYEYSESECLEVVPVGSADIIKVLIIKKTGLNAKSYDRHPTR